MYCIIAALCLVGMKLENDLSSSKIIRDYNENKISADTAAQVEEAIKWDRVYLATYPRSGNHWLRYLIEEATGIATSSVYRDPDPEHLEMVFPWGGFCCDHGYEGNRRYPENGETVVVKTHFPVLKSMYETLPHSRAVRIIRHPVDTFYSWHVFNSKNRIPQSITRYKLGVYMYFWREFQEYWDRQPNVLTIRYEDLYNAPAAHLKLVLDAIGYQVTQEDIDRAIAKYPPRGGLYKHYDHYTEDDLSFIDAELGNMMKRYGYEIRQAEAPNER